MIAAPSHGVMRIKKDNVSDVCGIVSGASQVLSDRWLLESSPELHVATELGVLWSTDFAAVPVSAPWADKVGHS